MLTPLATPAEAQRNLRRERRLWNDRAIHAPSMGCLRCPDREICGGLQVGDALFDCLSLCCHEPTDCDAVCRNKPEEFASRVREIEGFDFNNVPRAPVLQPPSLPTLVPLLYHNSGRSVPFRAPAVCLPLYTVIRRQDGRPRYVTANELAAGFGIDYDVPVILTGTAKDRPLERWWSLGDQRLEVIRGYSSGSSHGHVLGRSLRHGCRSRWLQLDGRDPQSRTLGKRNEEGDGRDDETATAGHSCSGLIRRYSKSAG
jgi:hypothetical protein